MSRGKTKEEQDEAAHPHRLREDRHCEEHLTSCDLKSGWQASAPHQPKGSFVHSEGDIDSTHACLDRLGSSRGVTPVLNRIEKVFNTGT